MAGSKIRVNIQSMPGTIDTGSMKECIFATTANLNLTTTALTAIDGVTPVLGDRVLVKNQTDATENGIYLANTAAWTRSPDAEVGTGQLHGGNEIPVLSGTLSGKSTFMLTLPASEVVDVDTDSITFEKISQTGSMVKADVVMNEDATGAVNGSNAVFTSAGNYTATKIGVYLNGVRQNLGVDYTETAANEITMTDAPKGNPSQADELVFDYIAA